MHSHLIATSASIWFNKYGDHDHNGLIYILAENKPILCYLKSLQREGLSETDPEWNAIMQRRTQLIAQFNFTEANRIEEWFPDTIEKAKRPHPLIVPLVLRVQAGRSVNIRLTNEIEGREIGLHLVGPGSSITSDGSDISTNSSTLVSYKNSKLFTWKCQHEGVFVFHDAGDFRGDENGTNVHGLFGALIVEPASSTWTNPETGYQLTSGLYADIHPGKTATQLKPYPNVNNPASLTKEYADPGDSFREFVIFIHDEPHWVAPHTKLETNPCDTNPGNPRPDPTDQHQVAEDHTLGSLMPISYRAEPMISRERALWTMIKNDEIDPDNIVVNEEQHHSSWLFGDPSTPVVKAYLGDPVRIRLVHAGVKETHVFHLHIYEWNAVPFHRDSNIIDAITIGPQTGHTIVPFYGAGNRQMVPGDVIWHCHLYPHFHHGMWGIFRTFDRMQDGQPGSYFHGDTGESMTESEYNNITDPKQKKRICRRLGFYPDMTPISKLLPLPDREPPPPQDLPNKKLGYPHFICGEVGQKSFTPPWHMPINDAENEGWVVTEYDYRQPTTLELNAFNIDPKPGELFTTFPHNDSEKSIHIDEHSGEKLRRSETVILGTDVLMTPIKYNHKVNQDGEQHWWDPHGHLFALDGHGIPTFAEVVHEAVHHAVNNKLAENPGMNTEVANALVTEEGITIEPHAYNPLFFRCNKTNVMQITLHNRLEKYIPATPFDSAWPKGIEHGCDIFKNYKAECGLHVHIVKFDPIACDGASTGWNYMSAPQVGKKMVYRWWADEEFGTIFTHDHCFANYRQKHGLFASLIVEPENATFHDPTNHTDIIEGPEAVIKYKDNDVDKAYREFCFGNGDWVPLFKLKHNTSDHHNPVRPTHNVHLPDTSIVHVAEIEQNFVAYVKYQAHDQYSDVYIIYGQPIEPPNHPDAHDDNGVFGINYKCEPLAERKFDPAEWFSSKEFVVPAEHPITNSSAATDPAEQIVSYGDPFTPIFKTIEGEPMRLRLVQGSHEEQHSFQIHGMRWQRFWKDAASPLQNQQTIGISEAFTFDIQNHYEPGDYLWKYSSAEDLWLGTWGFIRAFHVDSVDEEKPLPLIPNYSPTGAIKHPPSEQCRRFKVRAISQTVAYRPDLLDPFGLVYVLENCADPGGQMVPVKRNAIPEPLVLRCRQGEWLEVEVINSIPKENEPEPMYPELPHDDGDRNISNRISIHADLLRYDIQMSDGSNVGNNHDSTILNTNVSPGTSKIYYWFADEKLGAISLQDMADFRNHRHHGLIGAVVVHPQELTPYNVLPNSSSAIIRTSNQQWYGTRVTLVNHSLLPKHFRFPMRRIPHNAIIEDQVLLIQDGLRYFLHGSLATPIGDIPGDLPFERPDTEDQGLKGFNYKSEPSSHIRGYKIAPATPDIIVNANANVQLHLIGGCDKPRNHTFTIHGHSWREWEYLGIESPVISSQSGISSGFAKTLSFKANSKRGHYMYRSGVLKYMVEQGMWGLLKVR